MTAAEAAPRADSIWSARYAGVTLGAVALIFLAAIEALAVTTVMPVVSAELHGESLYAVAFAGTLATGVIGMVATGAWCDRAGPRLPVYTATALFVVGLVIAGSATDMTVFLIGRLVQGLGAGGQTVALYVVVARLYPSRLHGAIFGTFAAAWVVPSMIGPFLAGAVTEYLHWRWMFLGVAVLALLALLLVALRLHGVDLGQGEAEGTRGIGSRLMLAVVVAVAAVAVGLAVDAPPQWRWPGAVLAVAVIGVAILPLLPRGTLRAGKGLPSVILMRGLVAGAFFTAEAYIPYALMDRFAFPPTLAGLALTGAALAWSGASWLQGRIGDRLGSTRIAVISLAAVLAGVLIVLATVSVPLPPWLIVVGWTFAGGGMGLVYPRLNVLMLAYSTRGNEGFHSSALSIADSTGSAVALAVAGLLFGAAAADAAAFSAVFLLSIAMLLIALLPGLRLGNPPLRD
ncbi:MFS transporter [Microbacterium resistens]|uniref:MFS transporter n=1 Tax=Microbacterium resistens TaxID=156977 RepID=UPI00366B4873